jgi:hypothetical protein
MRSAFTIDRGNDIAVAAIEALRPYVVGRHVYGIVSESRSALS